MELEKLNPKERFSNRVEKYLKYRTPYPEAIKKSLITLNLLKPEFNVADIGSGTGLLTRWFLNHGNTVYAVEPNDAMRGAAEGSLLNYPNFHSVKGSAEDTTLSNASVDLIVAGEAFHWFDPVKARVEFQRIGKPGAHTVIIMKMRDKQQTPFLKAYDNLLRTFCTEYHLVKQIKIDFASFFALENYWTHTYSYSLEIGLEHLIGRIESLSYAPLADDPLHAEMVKEIKRIFAKHNENGKVSFRYNSEIIYGQL
jgi:ubiquinone/menaquinone biosynthesis C-methylase UbiE